LDFLKKEKISYRIDHPSGIAHNKIIIIDSEKVITGSYNFSNAAYKKNTENVLMLSDTKLAQEYSKNWDHRWALSEND
jgi:phosphatidylserine/phosphatidylglycerophosphate/cardiolipin synthase-like enzyme